MRLKHTSNHALVHIFIKMVKMVKKGVVGISFVLSLLFSYVLSTAFMFNQTFPSSSVFLQQILKTEKNQLIPETEKEATSIFSYAVLRPGKFGRGEAMSIAFSCPVRSWIQTTKYAHNKRMSTQPIILINRSKFSFDSGCIDFDIVIPKDCLEIYVLYVVTYS